MYSIEDHIGTFIVNLKKAGYELFDYLPNQDWKPGDQILYAGPYWDDQEPTAAISSLTLSRLNRVCT